MLADVLPGYASARNDATRADGASGLSPYLHFGILGPREIMKQIAEAQAGGPHKRKFADELLGWREWFHFQAHGLDAPEQYDRVAGWARATLANHAADPRPEIETLAAMLHGETRNETWNACQRQFLIDGWMHNNLRMYRAKPIIAMTPSPKGMGDRLLPERPAQPRWPRSKHLRQHRRHVRRHTIRPRTADLWAGRDAGRWLNPPQR